MRKIEPGLFCCLLALFAGAAQARIAIGPADGNGGFVSSATRVNSSPIGWIADKGVWIMDENSPLGSPPFGSDTAADSHAIQIHDDGGESLLCASALAVESGAEVRLSFDCRTAGQGARTTLTVSLWDEEADAPFATFATLSSADAPSAFRQLDYAIVAPAAHSNLRLRFTLTPGGRDIHIDRVHLSGATRVPEAPPEPVAFATVQRLLASDTPERIAEKAAKTLPRPVQIDWQRLELTFFIHYGVNTFNGVEWGTGDEEPKVFHPASLDAVQWVREIKAAGGRMVVLTAKHHDGFCLWPSRYTAQSTASSAWMGGRGDVVRAVADACRAEGLKLGIYLSPADLFQQGDRSSRRDGHYYGNGSPVARSAIPTAPGAFIADPAQSRTPPAGSAIHTVEADDYNRYFYNQLYELLTEYGRVDEVWFDGANPNASYDQAYDYPGWFDLIRKLQPTAAIAVGGPDVRWVGNERGIARETEWSVLPFSRNPALGRHEGGPPAMAQDIGSRSRLAPGSYLWWWPAEADTKILSGWFWKASHAVRDAAALLEIYYASVGRNANLLLNLSPDTRGLIPDDQLASLRAFGQIVSNTFAANLAAGAEAVASTGGIQPAARMLDGDLDTFWEAPGEARTADIVLTLPQPRTFDVVCLQEAIAQRGQRIEAFTVETSDDDSSWTERAKGTTVGHKRLLKLAQPATASRVRVRIEACRLNPALAEASLHREAVARPAPAIAERDAQGAVAIAGGGVATIRYTLDGSIPTAASPAYSQPVPLPEGGTVSAAAFSPDGLPGIVAVRGFPGVAPLGWRAVASTQADAAHAAANAIDDREATAWRSAAAGMPQFLAVDLGATRRLAGFTYLPSAEGGGIVKRYRFETRAEGGAWAVLAEGEFGNIEFSPVLQTIAFPPVEARQFRFTALEIVGGGSWAAAAEVGAVPAPRP